ncbi:MAG TPA: tetratricopeptide repeat protein [Fredinandcohnia sp.]|nr:tetratricopeptide repeat protein [Fredinandcohnia sp.]
MPRALAALLLLCLALAGCKGNRAEDRAALGIELGRKGDLGGALRAFDEALAADPNNLKALYNSGLALLGLGRGEAAAERFERFLALRPEDAKGHFHLARARLREHRREEAVRALQRAVELGFSDWWEWSAAGDLEAGLGGDFRFVQLGLVVAQRAGIPAADPRPGQGYVNRPMPHANLPGQPKRRCVAGDGQEVACAE